MAEKKNRRMTPEERAAREERQRFIDKVIADVARRAGIENTPEARRRYTDDVIADVARRAGIENTREARAAYAAEALGRLRPGGIA
jgi:hypothetical protein